MKKSYILILALLFILGLSACNKSGVDKSKETDKVEQTDKSEQADKSESTDTSESPDASESTDTNESTDTSENTDTSESKDANENTFKFSALGNEVSQEKTGELLKAAGISQEKIDEFLGQVKKYNDFYDNKSGDFVDYKELDYMDMIGKAQADSTKTPIGLGNNCRITTFGLLRDSINIGEKVEDKTSVLAFDKSSLAESKLFSAEDMKKFESFYAPIAAADSTDADKQVEAIKKALADRKIEFKNDKAKMISVYLNSKDEIDGNILFVGHTGVMVEDGGKFYFIEKLSFEEPYQVLAFESKEQMVDHLLKKYDFPLGENTAGAVVFENNERIK
ncbi:DUF4300 family protein [Ezakiella peruensis]|uniref:DUF4300 family protein n=1 Tax=Ezakiella peruensis TaxID=1464038 RepID=UPI000C1B4FF0|nr:DUF4300 family protein [Ezakiella peruensis]